MPNTYKWCDLLPEIDPDPDNKRELKKVVVSVIGRMRGTDGKTVKTIDGRVALGDPDPNNFIAHEDLTAKWIEEICEAKNGKFFREAIDRQLEADRHRPVMVRGPSQLEKAEPAPEPSG